MLPRGSWLIALRLIAAFVLLANGCYVALGAVEPIADTAVMVQHGTPRWALALVGVPLALAGRALIKPCVRELWTGHLLGVAAAACAAAGLLALLGARFFPA